MILLKEKYINMKHIQKTIRVKYVLMMVSNNLLGQNVFIKYVLIALKIW